MKLKKSGISIKMTISLVSILLFPKNIDDFSLLIQKKKPTTNSRYTVNKIVIFIEIPDFFNFILV
jgi:hypothetical protein